MPLSSQTAIKKATLAAIFAKKPLAVYTQGTG